MPSSSFRLLACVLAAGLAGCSRPAPTAPSVTPLAPPIATPPPQEPFPALDPGRLVDGLNILEAPDTMRVGEKRRLWAFLHPVPSEIDYRATWTSGDAAVLAVDGDGRVTARGPGATTVTAQVWSLTRTVTIRVEP